MQGISPSGRAADGQEPLGEKTARSTPRMFRSGRLPRSIATSPTSFNSPRHRCRSERPRASLAERVQVVFDFQAAFSMLWRVTSTRRKHQLDRREPGISSLAAAVRYFRPRAHRELPRDDIDLFERFFIGLDEPTGDHRGETVLFDVMRPPPQSRGPRVDETFTLERVIPEMRDSYDSRNQPKVEWAEDRWHGAGIEVCRQRLPRKHCGACKEPVEGTPPRSSPFGRSSFEWECGTVLT